MHFFNGQLSLTVLDKSYNLSLIIVSVIIAIVAAFTAFGIAERMHAARTKKSQLLWNFFGATAMGIGIWAMHFIGSLALILPVSVSYNLGTTLISVVPAILASGVVLRQMNQTFFNLNKLLFCGFLLGCGIGAMHHTGMAAMELNATMYYVTAIFIVSLVVAVLLATFALKIQFEATDQFLYKFINKKQCYSSIVMGLAISGMHYTAMKAVFFVPSSEKNIPSTAINADYLAIIVSLVVFQILLLAIVIPLLPRYRQMSADLFLKEEKLRVAAIAFQTYEAIMITNADSNIIRVNDAFIHLTGYTEAELTGKNPRILKSGKHDGIFYKNLWNAIIMDGKWIGEIWNRRKNGEIFLQWLAISAVKNEQGIVTQYVAFFSQIMEFRMSEKEIEKLAFYDPLTNLPNLRLLRERLNYELNIARRYHRTGALLFMDLDRFKNINDAMGHSMGDIVLIEAAQRLQSILRKSDTAIRLGGDEFVILISAQNETHTHLINQAQTVAEKIIAEINRPYLVANHELYISPSLGITLYTGTDDGVDLLLRRADTAMYQAKDAGGNTFRFYHENMQKVVDVRLMLEKNLRIAIDKKELSLHYQPQLSLAGAIIGAEALIRWSHPTLGMISPTEFIPIAENTGLIVGIGNWIMQTVCDHIKEWQQHNVIIPHISINISPRQFHQADFVSIVAKIITDNKIQPAMILLEITEGVFLKNIDEAIDKMNALKQKGFRFSIDDFGTGYSSLAYLKRLPFDELKIDKSFIRDLIDDPSDAAIVKAIIVMAEGLGLDLIAEGVETSKQLAFLSDYGCRYFQGYYLSKPLSSNQFEAYFLDHSGNSEPSKNVFLYNCPSSYRI
jgi:diguanylate cyclase (GGDEF)-like protein/PAS domain S-box-containing protein